MKKQARTREQIYALINQWQGSGLKQKEFCNKHNIAYYTFKYYRTQKNREETKAATTASFVSVKVKETNALQGVTITYPNGVRLDMENIVGTEQLKTLIHLF